MRSAAWVLLVATASVELVAGFQTFDVPWAGNGPVQYLTVSELDVIDFTNKNGHNVHFALVPPANRSFPEWCDDSLGGDETQLFELFSTQGSFASYTLPHIPSFPIPRVQALICTVGTHCVAKEQWLLVSIVCRAGQPGCNCKADLSCGAGAACNSSGLCEPIPSSTGSNSATSELSTTGHCVFGEKDCSCTMGGLCSAGLKCTGPPNWVCATDPTTGATNAVTASSGSASTTEIATTTEIAITTRSSLGETTAAAITNMPVTAVTTFDTSTASSRTSVNTDTGTIISIASSSSKTPAAGDSAIESAESSSSVIVAALVAVALVICGIIVAAAVILSRRRKKPSFELDELDSGSRTSRSQHSGSLSRSYNSTNGTASSNSQRGRKAYDSNAMELLDFVLEYDDLEILNPPIGRGAFGIVNKAHFRGNDVAVKTFLIDMDDGSNAAKEFEEEAAMMAKLRHPNVVLLMGVTHDPHCLVMEFAERGSLRTIIVKHPELLTKKRCVNFLRDMALGMMYLHSQKPIVLHRDLKSQNILVFENYACKLCDFGIAREQAINIETMTSRAGTTRWQAPEVSLKGSAYGPAADVFSFALVVSEMYIHKLPFEEEYRFDHQVEDAMRSGKRPVFTDPAKERMAEGVRELVERMWAKDPEARPTFKDVAEEINEIRARTLDAMANPLP